MLCQSQIHVFFFLYQRQVEGLVVVGIINLIDGIRAH